MAAKKNGRSRGEQPSKPSRRITEKVEHVVAADRGTTIREEFAMAALQGYLAGRNAMPLIDSQPEKVAEACVRYADALVAALAKDGSA